MQTGGLQKKKAGKYPGFVKQGLQTSLLRKWIMSFFLWADNGLGKNSTQVKPELAEFTGKVSYQIVPLEKHKICKALRFVFTESSTGF